MVSIVQIGYGNAARYHRNACYYPNDYKVVAVVNVNPEKIKKAKEEGFQAYSFR